MIAVITKVPHEVQSRCVQWTKDLKSNRLENVVRRKGRAFRLIIVVIIIITQAITPHASDVIFNLSRTRQFSISVCCPLSLPLSCPLRKAVITTVQFTVQSTCLRVAAAAAAAAASAADRGSISRSPQAIA